MKKPKVSVLMPVYNASEYVFEAIDSILAQTFEDFELILIDDGSKDDSWKIINQIEDSRIKKFQNDGNKGLVYTLNRGIELAEGEYIARIDADDYALPERLEKQVQILDKDKNIVLCGSWIKLFGTQKNIWKVPQLDEDIKSSLLINSTIYHPAAIFRKDFLIANNLKYSEDYKHSEDYKLWSEMAEKGKFYNIQEILVLRRMHTTNIGVVYSDEQKKNVERIREEQLNRLKINPTDEELRLHHRFANNMLNKSDIDKIEKWIIKLLVYNKKNKVYKRKSLRKSLRVYYKKLIEKEKLEGSSTNLFLLRHLTN